MRTGDRQVGLAVMHLREAGHEIIRRVHAQQLGDVQRLLADEAGRVAYPAHGGIFHQRLDGGGAGNADVDRQVNACGAQPPRPFRHRTRLEQELRCDEAFNAIGLEIGLLLLQRLQQHGLAVHLGDVGVAFGVAGDAERRDSVRLEHTGLHQLDRRVILADGLRRAAAQHQHGVGAGLGQRLDAGAKVGLVTHEAGRHMRNRLEACSLQLPHRLDLGGKIAGIDQRHEDAAAGHQLVLQQGQLLDLLRRDLDGGQAQERGGGGSGCSNRGVHENLAPWMAGHCASRLRPARMFATPP